MLMGSNQKMCSSYNIIILNTGTYMRRVVRVLVEIISNGQSGDYYMDTFSSKSYEKTYSIYIFRVGSRQHAHWSYFGSVVGPVQPRSLRAGLVSVFGGFCTGFWRIYYRLLYYSLFSNILTILKLLTKYDFLKKRSNIEKNVYI